MTKLTSVLVWITFVSAGVGSAWQTAHQPPPILTYIKASWKMLTRSNRDLAIAAVDPKFHPAEDGRWPVYVAEDESLPAIEQ